ncbi:MAG: hypothetical protein J2P54_15845 [Bradyrhizobiaceae bacterium]|nr:hypothetical protein [Bradyrhizobiaceae bacterium]
MRRIIGTVVAVAALGIAASTIPAAAQHHGGAGGHGGPAGGMASGFAGGHGGMAGPGSAFVGGRGPGPGPGFGMARPGPGPSGAFAPRGNFAARTFVNPGFRGDRRFAFRHGRRFAFGGFGAPWFDYGPDYAYDYGYDYGSDCYTLQRVFVAGRWRLRTVWICG